MQTITRQQLLNGLKSLKGATPVTIIADTDARLLKEGNPHPDCRKRSMVNGFVNFVYEKSVNRQRVRENKTDDFQAKSRQWGHKVNKKPLVQHKGRYYLEIKVQRVLGTTYHDNGSMVPNHVVEPFRREASPTRQGLEKEVILRDYALENIVGVNINGEVYQVV